MKKKRYQEPMNHPGQGKGGGRRKKADVMQGTQIVIDYSAPEAAKILRDVVKGTRKRISAARQRACEFRIQHAIGTPTQKVQMKHTGAPLTYQELADRAAAIIKAAQGSGKTMGDVIKEAEAVATMS